MADKVLVTGGAGYIGSHACLQLATAGYEPVVVDNLSRGFKEAVQWGPFYQGDVRDVDFLAGVFQKEQPRYVMHFAAYAYVGESVTAPLHYYDNNVVGSLRLLQTIAKTDSVEGFVFSSTCATYGVPKLLPLDETFEQKPINPYGASKLMVERMILDWQRVNPAKKVAIFRYFNAAGSDFAGRIGESHEPETHLIPVALMSLLQENSPPLTINGRDFPTRDGTCVRDYLHVLDLVDAHVLAISRWMKMQDSKVGIWNLATGKGSSNLEIVKMIEQVTKKKVSMVWGPRREGDPPELYATGEKAKAELGWQPSVSDLEKIISSAWHWIQKKR